MAASTYIEKVEATVTAIGNDILELRNRVGTLTNLDTTAQGSIVAAINELHTQVSNINVTSVIDDTLNTSLVKTYSIDKIKVTIQSYIDDLVNGAPTALDTLLELANAITDNDTDLATLLTAVDNRVSYDPQTKTALQKTQARANIGAMGVGDAIGDGNVTIELAMSYFGLAIGSTQNTANQAVNSAFVDLGDLSTDPLATYNTAAGN